jgi:hypothetical protein
MALNCAVPPIGPTDEPGVKYALLLAGRHSVCCEQSHLHRDALKRI